MLSIVSSCKIHRLITCILLLKGTTEDWYDKGKSGPYPGLIIRKANKKLVNYPRMAFVAHFYFRSRLNLPQAHTYINQVRQPVRRLVSHYHYMRSRNRPKNRLKEFLASKEKKESLEKCVRQQHKGCRSNVMTRFFCGRHYYCRKGTLRALLKAKHNVKRFYAVVGLLETYDIYLQILNKRLPKFFPKISSGDIGRFKYNPDYNFDDVPKGLTEEIERANWADKSLYSFIKRRFWKQAQAVDYTLTRCEYTENRKIQPRNRRELKQGRRVRQREYSYESVISRFSNHSSIIPTRLACKLFTKYPRIKVV